MSRPAPIADGPAADARATLPDHEHAAFDRLAGAVLASPSAPLGPLLRAQLPGTTGVRWLRQEDLPPTTRPGRLTSAHWLSLFTCWSAAHRAPTAGGPARAGPAGDRRPTATRPGRQPSPAGASSQPPTASSAARSAARSGNANASASACRSGQAPARQASARPRAAGEPSTWSTASLRPPRHGPPVHRERLVDGDLPVELDDAEAGGGERGTGQLRPPQPASGAGDRPADLLARQRQVEQVGHGPGRAAGGHDRLGRPVAVGTARRARRRPRPPGPARPAPAPAGPRRSRRAPRRPGRRPSAGRRAAPCGRGSPSRSRRSIAPSTSARTSSTVAGGRSSSRTSAGAGRRFVQSL